MGLLTGSTRRPVKREITEMAAAGNLDLLIGTQALIQSADPAVQTLGVLALGCAGARTGVGADLQGALNLSGGAGLAAILECGVASDCTLPPSESSGPKGALRSYALTLQTAGQ